MPKPIIEVTGLSKSYRLGRTSASTLRDEVARFFGRGKARAQSADNDLFWALRDVSFTAKKGEIIGVIGRNGGGKSTLLKILSRITTPSEGEATLRGRSASLLEVGTGFHPELTGRENVFLNGAILGMKRREIEAKFEEIVEFSEIADFIGTPVKRYSSGMYVRLAFAVAAHLEPEILIVDEVLAVGDAKFQAKCLAKMQEVAQQGRTIMFVSHDNLAVESLCERAIWMNHGRVQADGPCREVMRAYMTPEGSSQAHVVSFDGSLEITRVTLLNSQGRAETVFSPGEPMTVELEYWAKRQIQSPVLALFINSENGQLFAAHNALDGQNPPTLEGRGIWRCHFPQMPLQGKQSLRLAMSMRQGPDAESLIRWTELVGFTTMGTAITMGWPGGYADRFLSGSGPMCVPYQWELDGKKGPLVEPKPFRG